MENQEELNQEELNREIEKLSAESVRKISEAFKNVSYDPTVERVVDGILEAVKKEHEKIVEVLACPKEELPKHINDESRAVREVVKFRLGD